MIYKLIWLTQEEEALYRVLTYKTNFHLKIIQDNTKNKIANSDIFIYRNPHESFNDAIPRALLGWAKKGQCYHLQKVTKKNKLELL